MTILRLKAFRVVVVVMLVITGAVAVADAQVAGPSLSKVFTPNIIGPGSVSTITFTITNPSASPMTGIAFIDPLPAGEITIADPANASTTCDLSAGGSLTAPVGGATITLSDARLGASQVCTVRVDVTASTPGVHTNPAVLLTWDLQNSAMSLPINLTVVTTLPGFSKSFAPNSVPLGGRSTLTLTIDNTANAAAVLNLGFTDNLPAGMLIADPASASTDCFNPLLPPTFTAVPGTSVIVLSANGIATFPVVPAGGTCSVTVDVVAVGGGALNNVTNDLLVNFVSSGKASATLDVTVTPIALQKSFTDDPVPPGGSATLEFRIDNFNRNFSATGIGFTDDLTTLVPTLAGLTFSSVLANDCGGSFTGVGGTAIGFSGGTLAAEAFCTIRVSLAVPGVATPGSYTNTTTTITAIVNGSPVVGNQAADDLFVEPAPILTKEFLEAGTLTPDPVINPGDDVVLRFTITNTSATSGATAIAFIDELTDSGPNTGFLPLPISVALPPTPNPPCGVGSSLALVGVGIDGQGLSLTGGNLTAAPGAGATCTFDVTVTVPVGLAPGVYLNTTQEITATIDGAMRTGDPASDTLTVIAAPSLSKSFSDDPVAPGDTVTLEFTLTYPADASGDATAITFTDNLAPVLTGLTANFPPSPDPPCGVGSTLTGSAGDTLVTLQGGTLSPGGSCTFSVTLDVPAGAAPGSYPNTTSGVGATVQGLPATSAPASDNLRVAGLNFTKEFLGDPVVAGDTVTLRFTIDNIHPTDDATITFFTDNLAANLPGLAATGLPTFDDCGGTLSGTTLLNYAGGAVLSGSSCTIEVPVLVPAAAADGDYANTTSALVATQGGGVTIDPAVDILTVNSNLLQLTKAFTDDPVTPGDSVTLEFNLSNLDAAQAALAVGFTDDLGAALTGLTFDSVLLDTCGGTVLGTTTTVVTVSGVSLAAGGSCMLRVSLTVPGGAAAGVYPNTTSAVTGNIGGFPVSGDLASDDLVVAQLLQFSKSFDGPSTATGMATLTFTITNPGINTAGQISFSDDLDNVIPGLIATGLPALPCGAGSSLTGISFLTFTGGELPPAGGTCSFDVDVLVPAAATFGSYPNTTSDLYQAGLIVADPAVANLTIEPAPTVVKVFAPDSIGLGQASTLTFTIDNSASAVAAGNLALSDALPAGVIVATPSVTANTCGGTLTAAAGTGLITLTGGSVGAGATCAIDVDVAGAAVGAMVNTTGDLTSSSGNSGTAGATLVVNPQPGFSKLFAANPIFVGGTSTLTFSINNSASSVAATGLAFIDNLPAAVTIATPANVVNTCGGTVTAIDGGASITLVGGTVALGTNCTVAVDVTSGTAGSYANVTGDLTSSLGNSGTATDTLDVNAAPGFTKSFAPDAITIGGTSVLTLTINNSTNTVDATGLDVTDNLPAGLMVATPSNAATTCTGGTLTAVSGSAVISFTGGTVALGLSCIVTVDVTSDSAGSYVNVTGDLTSSLGTSGTATDTLDVYAAPGFAKSFIPDAIVIDGTSGLTLTIDNSTNTVDATGLDVTDNLPAGLIVATPSNASTTCSGGTLTAVPGAGVISYTGGTAPTGTSCVVTVDVTSGAAGSYVNVTGDLTSSLGNSGTASDTLDVIDAMFELTKTFLGDPVLRGDTIVLEFTLTNTSSLDLSNIAFSDDLAAALPGLAAVGLPAADVCGAGSALVGTTMINLTGGVLAPAASCTFQATLQVPADAPLGLNTNLTSMVTADTAGGPVTSPPAMDDLEVIFLDFVKVFLGQGSPGGLVDLRFTITNPSASSSAVNIDFTDDLDAVIPGLVAIDLPHNDVCGAGSILSGSSIVALTGGTLAPASSCTFDVTLQIPATVGFGSYTNTTSILDATVGGSAVTGDAASVAIDDLVMQSAAGIPTLAPKGLMLLAFLMAIAGMWVVRLRR